MGNISYSFIHDKKLIIEVYQGTISADMFYNHQNELLNDPEFDPTYSYFTDIRKSVIQLTDEEREKLYEYMRVLSTNNQNPRKIAVLTESPSEVVEAFMYEVETGKSSPVTYKIFSTKEAAFQWLEKDPDS
jgi:hypothetical protein